MTDDLLLTRTVSKSYELVNDEPQILLDFTHNRGTFIITDLIISKKGGELLLQMDDGENRFVILTMDEDERKFNHNFTGGLQSWRGARLVAKKTDGEKVTIFVNYIGNPHGMDWTVWSNRVLM